MAKQYKLTIAKQNKKMKIIAVKVVTSCIFKFLIKKYFITPLGKEIKQVFKEIAKYTLELLLLIFNHNLVHICYMLSTVLSTYVLTHRILTQPKVRLLSYPFYRWRN